MRITTVFNKLLDLQDAFVRGVAFDPAGTLVDVGNKHRRYRCPLNDLSTGGLETLVQRRLPLLRLGVVEGEAGHQTVADRYRGTRVALDAGPSPEARSMPRPVISSWSKHLRPPGQALAGTEAGVPFHTNRSKPTSRTR